MGSGIGAARQPGEAGVKIYVRVDDLGAYLDRAENLGGVRVVPPTDLPGDFGRFRGVHRSGWQPDRPVGLDCPGER